MRNANYMKDLKVYIKESAEDGKNGHWEEFVDEDTGDIVSIWRPDDTPKILALIKKYDDEAAKIDAELAKVWDDEKKLHHEILDLRSELIDIKSSIKSKKDSLRQLFTDMEEEVANAKESDKDKVANEYGEKMSEVEKEIENFSTKYSQVAKHISELENKLSVETENKLYDKKKALQSECNKKVEELRKKL